MNQYIITTDAVSARVEAGSKDLAAQQFADREPVYQGQDIQSLADLADAASRLGGWARINEA